MANKKMPRYKKTGKIIGIDTGFVQAATLLDIAANEAINKGTAQDIVEVADAWMNLSLAMKTVLGLEPQPDDEDDPEGHGNRERSGPVGFGVTAKEIKDHHDRNH